jgi:hypothetical protein
VPASSRRAACVVTLTLGDTFACLSELCVSIACRIYNYGVPLGVR